MDASGWEVDDERAFGRLQMVGVIETESMLVFMNCGRNG